MLGGASSEGMQPAGPPAYLPPGIKVIMVFYPF